MMENELSDEEAIRQLALAMKDNAPQLEDKHTVHTFLHNIAISKDTKKVGNLRDDEKMNELGSPTHNVRGSFDMARISKEIMGNDYFAGWFKSEAESTLATSLSREGFLVRMGTTTTKQIADITKRRKINKGWFGSRTTEVSGGDTTATNQYG